MMSFYSSGYSSETKNKVQNWKNKKENNLDVDPGTWMFLS